MTKQNLSLELISESIITVDKLGISKTIDCLKQAREKSIPRHDEAHNIINICCKHLKVDKLSIFAKSNSKDIRTDCLGVCFYLLEKYLYHTQRELSIFFSKDRSVISRYITRIKNLNPKILDEKNLLLNIEEMEKDVLKIKNKK